MGVHLDNYIKWSNLASAVYPNEEIECTKKWAKLNTSGIGYRLDFLENFADLCAGLSRDKTASTPAERLHLLTQHNMDTFFKAGNYEFYKKYKAEPYNQEKMRKIDLDNNDFFVNEGPMGAGKTFQIFELIKANPSAYKRILIISPRKSFSKEKVAQFKKFADCVNMYDYQDKTVQMQSDWLVFDQLAIQVESLYHLHDISELNAYDLVIMDESESVIYQFASPTHPRVQESFEVLNKVIMFSTKVIFADAFITSRTVNYIEQIKLLRPQARVSFENNTYMKPDKLTANILGEVTRPKQLPMLRQKYIDHIVQKAAAGEKLCVVSGSFKLKAAVVEALITSKILDKSNILEYDSTADDKLFEDLGNVEVTWADPKIRLVIYTTSITIGIDFSIKCIFDSICIYGTSACPIARDLIQAHHRVRNIKDTNIYIAINACYMASAFYTKDSLTRYHRDIENELKKYCNDHGATTCMNIYNVVTTDNMLEERLGFSAYQVVFKYLLERAGYKINYMEDKDSMQLQPSDDDYDAVAEAESAVPSDYPIDYEKRIRASDEKIDKIKLAIKEGKATAKQKKKAATYFFHKHNILYVTDLYLSDHGQPVDLKQLPIENEGWTMNENRANILEQTANESFANDLFYQYTNNRDVKSHIDNIVMGVYKEGYQNMLKAQDQVHSVKEKALMHKYVQMTCNILKLETSYDTETVIKDEQLHEFTECYNQNPTMAKIFGIRLRGKDKEIKIRQCVSIISSIFKKWNGFKLEVISSKNDTNRKTENCNYVCKLKNDGIVGVYTTRLLKNPVKTPQERIMFV